MGKFSAHEKILEIVREISMRENVYPRWIREGRITQSVADFRINILKEIREDLDRFYFGKQEDLGI